MTDDKKTGRAGRYIRCADCGSIEVYTRVDGWYCPTCDTIDVKVERTNG